MATLIADDTIQLEGGSLLYWDDQYAVDPGWVHRTVDAEGWTGTDEPVTVERALTLAPDQAAFIRSRSNA